MNPAPRLVAALLAAALALCWASCAGAVIRGSSLALPSYGGPRAQPALEQRSIDRAWGPSEDSLYSTVEVPGWKSDGLAAGMSLIAPGSGQAYVGEGSWVWYALVEVAGWTANRVYAHKSETARDNSAALAGDPADTASAWSFERWAEATGQDPARIAAIWASDRQAFYEMIAREPAGWRSAGNQAEFADLRSDVQDYSKRATRAGVALWFNHLVAAVDALHAARNHNVMLQKNLQLKLRTSWQHGQPALVARLVRSF
jgi:hypothetical protein